MICLNLVQDDKDHVEHGLFLVGDDLYSMLKQQKLKEILVTNATTIDGECDVAKYFKVEKSGIHYYISGMQKKGRCWFQKVLQAIISCQIRE